MKSIPRKTTATLLFLAALGSALVALPACKKQTEGSGTDKSGGPAGVADGGGQTGSGGRARGAVFVFQLDLPEPFFGAGWIFFKKTPAKENYINDTNSDLMNLYEVVRDEPQELIRLSTLTPKSEAEFKRLVNLYWNNRTEFANEI